MDIDKSDTPAPRVTLEMDVEYRRSYARQSEKGILKNISLTGAFLEGGADELSPNDKLVVTLTVSGRVRKIPAAVVWRNGMGCGVKFMPTNKRDVQIVDDLMYFVENKKKSRKSVLDDIFKQVG